MTNTLTITSDNVGVYEIYNVKTKEYPSGLLKLKKNSFDTWKGFTNKNNLHNGKSTEKQLEEYLKKRVKERKEKIIDIAFCNSWQYFLTLTFDTKNTDFFPNGYSHLQAIELLKKFLNNQHHKNKNMKYIVVSEFHKESGNLHFHGLFSNVKWDLIPAINPHTNKEIFKNGCQIFNLNDYDYGFSTISEIKDSRKVSLYLSKYITKDLISLKNKKVFWYSRNLKKPIIDFHYITNDLEEFIDHNNEILYNETFFKNHCNIQVMEILKKT